MAQALYTAWCDGKHVIAEHVWDGMAVCHERVLHRVARHCMVHVPVWHSMAYCMQQPVGWIAAPFQSMLVYAARQKCLEPLCCIGMYLIILFAVVQHITCYDAVHSILGMLSYSTSHAMMQCIAYSACYRTAYHML